MGREWPDTVVAGSPIKANQISGLRSAVDQDLAAAGRSFPWSWAGVAAGDAVLAKHLTEMRGAIQVLWDFKQKGPLPMWSSGVTPGGPSVGTTQTAIRASDVTDLRTWLNMYEDNHPGLQGVSSVCYDPELANPPLIRQNWAQGIVDLRLGIPPDAPRLFVRCNVKARPGGIFTEQDKSNYAAAFNIFRQNQIRVFALFTMEFYPSQGPLPADPLDEGDFANPYIRAFAEQAREISTYLHANAGVDDYIIWNEPNVSGKDNTLDAEHFAALLYHCWQSMLDAPRVYWGGIHFGPGTGDDPDQNSLSYIRQVYDALYSRGLCGGEYGAWPWTGINVHIHGDRTGSHFQNLFDGLDGIRTARGDSGDLLIGEWGFQLGSSPDSLEHAFNCMKGRASTMFYFSYNRVSDNGEWGLREYSIAPNQYVLGQVIEPQFYSRFDTLVGS